MKTLFQAIGMALILFLYGYFLSIAGHDHSAHQRSADHHENVSHEHQTADGHEHNHDHSRWSGFKGRLIMLEWLQPLHPKVVHFPIALFITAFGLEVLNWILGKKIFHQCAVCIYVLAALMTPLIVRTGLWEAERLHLNHPLLGQHQTVALWTTWTALMSLPALWFFNRRFPKIFRILFILCLVITSIFVTLTGDRGGKMVYEYGVGVEQ